MGGKAIIAFGIEPRRILPDEYRDIVREVSATLDTEYSGRYKLIPSYHTKPDFGDADILVKINKHLNPREFIENKFKVKYPIHNGECYSFPFRKFQIDLIYVDESIFDVSLAYFSWNDAGNLCGRSYRSLGLKYGHEGLYFTVRPEHLEEGGNNTHIVRDVCLSRNPQEILEFCGFDWNQFQNGFNTLPDMYDWVCRGSFFNPEKFQYENLNNTNKTRKRKRETYRYFLEWLEDNKQNYSQFNFDSNKRTYLPMILSAFPHLKQEMEIALQQYERKKLIDSRFNGHLVREWTGLRDKELGNAIQKFISSFNGRDNYLNFVADNSDETVKSAFLDSRMPQTKD
jgi:hypothetical protein